MGNERDRRKKPSLRDQIRLRADENRAAGELDKQLKRNDPTASVPDAYRKYEAAQRARKNAGGDVVVGIALAAIAAVGLAFPGTARAEGASQAGLRPAQGTESTANIPPRTGRFAYDISRSPRPPRQAR